MRTYYRGPDAIVTEASLTTGPRLRQSFALSDLDADQLEIKSEANGSTPLTIAAIVFATSSLGCVSTTLGVLEQNWWIVLGGAALAAVIFLATYVPLYLRDDSIFVLTGVHRGIRTRLYASPSEAKTFRIRYAVLQALEGED